MKKQKRQLLMLCLLLLAFTGLYFGLKAYRDAKEQEKAAEKQIPVFSVAMEEIEGLEFAVEGERYTFLLENGHWTCAEQPELILNDQVMDVKAGYMENLTALEKITSREKEKDMGLEEPTAVVKVLTQEKEYEFALGAYNWLLTGYYLSYEDQIYLVGAQVYNAFTCTLDSMTKNR